jgi:diphthamide synthase (EF-2-diphthine--ammonia ligase)
MTTCSTWHVRVDVVEDEGRIRARAKLIGAPTAMLDIRQDRDKTIHDLEELLASWRSLDELAVVLAEALTSQHQRHGVSEHRTA